jgi:hypothetical protein
MEERIACCFDPILGLTILYGLVIAGVVAVLCTALSRVPPQYGATLRNIFRQTRFLELTTVLVIIISGTYLAFSSKLSQGIVALLSGIAGYVLGGLANREEPTPPPPPPTEIVNSGK